MLKVMLAAIVLVVLAFAGLGIKLLLDRNAEFSGGSCRSSNASDPLSSKGFSCGCGAVCDNESKQ
ncbi:MAG: hypothetical protein WD052_02290 [Bacteroidales bacterium]